MHIGIVGPIHIPSLKKHIKSDISGWIVGMGGTPVNHHINALLDDGHKVSVFSLTPELNVGEKFEWHQDNLSIYVGPFRKRARRRCLDLFRQERNYIKTAILSADPKIIHAHWQYEWAWAALDSKIPTLVTCHDSPINVLKAQKDLYRLIRLVMSSIVLRKADYLSAVSPYTAFSLKYFTRKQISIVPNFEPDHIFQLYSKDRKELGHLKIAMVNNGFFGLKNVSKGISAFIEFQKKFPDAELYLYGFGHGKNQDAYKWCKKMNYEKNIHFKGEMNFDDLIKEFSQADILLHTSLEESCPMVVIEAFAWGMPVIGGKKSGGMPWMIENGCGCLVDVENVESIVNGLLYLSDKNIYSQSSTNARKLALRRFSKESVMSQYFDLYNKVLLSERNVAR
ncbi:MAG: glycosyltransferase [Flavobacterium sp.]|nr:MAG: glycosyltransferase [Flavobacterium sp.]